MARKDTIHDAVKNALIKDGWTITADPFTLTYKDMTTQVDLAAELPIEAERGGRSIVVEIKSFIQPSPVHDLQQALGQCLLYSDLLALNELDHEIYLAVSEDTYNRVFKRPSVQEVMQRHPMPIVIVRIPTEEIVQWID